MAHPSATGRHLFELPKNPLVIQPSVEIIKGRHAPNHFSVLRLTEKTIQMRIPGHEPARDMPS